MAAEYFGMAKAAFEAIAALAKEAPGIRKMFASHDQRIREVAKEMQEEIVGYCNFLEHAVKEARSTLAHDKDLLDAPLNSVDAKWAARNSRWNTFLKRSPSRQVKRMLQSLDGFGDRLTSLLICQERQDELSHRAGIEGEKGVAYSKILGENLPIGKILDLIEKDIGNLRKEAGGWGTI